MHNRGLLGVLLLLGLSGCGVGGSNFNVFAAFSALGGGQTYQMSGPGIVAEYDTDPASGAVVPGPIEPADVTVQFSLDGVGDFSQASIAAMPTNAAATRPPSVQFNTAAGDILADGDTLDPITADYLALTSANDDRIAVAGDPAAAGFEFQSFGIWATGLNAGMGVVGAASVGAPTSARGVPLGGLASYFGMSAGFYVDPDGDAFLAFADFRADLEFGNMSIDVFSDGTDVIDISTGVPTAMPSLNFVGAGAVSPNGGFMANISAVDLAGVLDGQLYGPGAEELGGVFRMSGAAGQYFGAVGAAQ